MTSTRPYLVRAFYEWIVDNDYTPHVVVFADHKEVDVPREYVENGQIVLNISMTAVQQLELTNEAITFDAKFSGKQRWVFVPMSAVMAIYARENGRGMVFSDEEFEPPPEDEEDGTEGSASTGTGRTGKKGGKSHLTIVK